MINSVAMSFVLTINVVLLPRMNNSFETNKERDTQLRRQSADFMVMLALPVIFGIIGIADWTMWLFGGDQFAPAALQLKIIAPTILLVTLASWNSSQRLIPLGKEKSMIIIYTISAVLSLALNFALLYSVGYIGPAITWLVVEFVGFLIGGIYLRKKDGFRIFHLSQLKYLIAASVMFVATFFLQTVIPRSWLGLFVVIGASVLIYGLMLLILKDKNTLATLRMVGKKMKRKDKESDKSDDIDHNSDL